MKISPRLLRLMMIFAAFLFATLAIIALWYWLSFTEVTFEIDGQRQRVRVRAETVSEAIEVANVLLEPTDIVAPALDTPLGDAPVISIDKAEQVAIDVQGELIRHYTHETDPMLILQEAGITPNSDDILLINGIPELVYQEEIPPRIIQIQRGYTVQIDDGGITTDQRTTAETVSGALRSTGLTFYLADQIVPALETSLDDGLPISIERSKATEIEVDGQTLITRAYGETVGEILAALGIALGGQDYTIPAENTPFRSGQRIRVVRVKDEIEFQREPLLYETIYQADPNLPFGEEVIQQVGQIGEQEARIRIRYEDGREVSRIRLESEIIIPPVDEIIAYGTQVVTNELDTPNGAINYWRMIPMQISVNPNLTANTAAADPEIIPVGTMLYIESVGQIEVTSALEGARYMLQISGADYPPSTQSVNVYLLLPIPEVIPYLLPEQN